MRDICNFIPAKENKGDIEYFHFVYEANYKKLRQPFMQESYYMYLVFKGRGKLKLKNNEYALSKGTLFFTFPDQIFEIRGTDDLTYLYISFDGYGVDNLLKEFKINKDNFIYYGFEHLFEFWMTSIRRVNKINASTLTESVFMYSLSYINNSKEETPDKFETILNYIDTNCTEHDISIKKLADLFFYNKKYFSSLFTKKMDIKFTEYVNSKRIEKAIKFMENSDMTISEISAKCGFSDPFYFSKVFKKFTGTTPTAYMKESNRK